MGGGIVGQIRENEMRFNYGCEKGDGEGPPPSSSVEREEFMSVSFHPLAPLHTDSGIRHISVSEEKYDMKFVPFYG